MERSQLLHHVIRVAAALAVCQLEMAKTTCNFRSGGSEEYQSGIVGCELIII